MNEKAKKTGLFIGITFSFSWFMAILFFALGGQVEYTQCDDSGNRLYVYSYGVRYPIFSYARLRLDFDI